MLVYLHEPTGIEIAVRLHEAKSTGMTSPNIKLHGWEYVISDGFEGNTVLASGIFSVVEDWANEAGCLNRMSQKLADWLDALHAEAADEHYVLEDLAFFDVQTMTRGGDGIDFADWTQLANDLHDAVRCVHDD